VTISFPVILNEAQRNEESRFACHCEGSLIARGNPAFLPSALQSVSPLKNQNRHRYTPIILKKKIEQ